jgi:phage terminase large subunit
LSNVEIRQNDIFKPLFYGDQKYAILRGGSGSGKSYAVADFIILAIAHSKRRWIVARKYATTIRQSVFTLICRRIADMGLSRLFKINKSDLYIEGPRGGSIIFIGLDDVNKLKSVYDPTDAFIEEADQVTQDDFEEIDRRIRTVGSKPRIILAFNPTSIYSWLKKYFYDSKYIPENELLIIESTYRDNKFIDPAYRDTIERLQETNPSAYRVYGLGEWGIVEGVVFDKWDIQDAPEGARLQGYGLDFGYSNDPTALIEVWQRGDDIWLRERIYQTGLTNQDIGFMMKEMGINHHATIIADSAEPKSIEELYRLHFNIRPCVKGNDSIRNGIMAMKAKRLHLFSDSVNLHKEFSSYSWKQDKNRIWINDPIDMFNHGVDAARYFISSRPDPVRAGPSGLGV